MSAVVAPAGDPLSSDRSDAWEVLSQLSSHFTLVDPDDSDDDAASTTSVSTRNGYPSLLGDEVLLFNGDDSDDSDDISTAAPGLSFKEALLGGAGGVHSDKAKSLSEKTKRARRAAALVKRKARVVSPTTKKMRGDLTNDEDPLDYEYYGRKAKGFNRYKRNFNKPPLPVLKEQPGGPADGGADNVEDVEVEDDDFTY